MQLVKPSVVAITDSDLQKKIERCFRMCYRSEDKMKEGSEAFLSKIIHSNSKNHHWSPLEHARITLTAHPNLWLAITTWSKHVNCHFVDCDHCDPSKEAVITANFRTLMEFCYSNDADVYIRNEVKNSLILALHDRYPYIFNDTLLDTGNDFKGNYVHDIKEAGDYQTFCITTTRDILQEFARHRSLSFSVESTRYCNYGKRGMTFTLPEPYEWSKNVCTILDSISPETYVNQESYVTVLNQDGERRGQTLNANDLAKHVKHMHELYIVGAAISEALYNRALELGAKPQEARMLLPGGLTTNMIVTGTFDAWKKFIQLRDDDAAHPQIRILAKDIRNQLDTLHPGWDNQ